MLKQVSPGASIDLPDSPGDNEGSSFVAVSFGCLSGTRRASADIHSLIDTKTKADDDAPCVFAMWHTRYGQQ